MGYKKAEYSARNNYLTEPVRELHISLSQSYRSLYSGIKLVALYFVPRYASKRYISRDIHYGTRQGHGRMSIVMAARRKGRVSITWGSWLYLDMDIASLR